MQPHLKILTTITDFLVQANVGIPVLFGAVVAISAILKALTGTGPTLVDIANLIDKQLDQNDTAIRAEIDRLKQSLGVVAAAKKT